MLPESTPCYRGHPPTSIKKAVSKIVILLPRMETDAMWWVGLISPNASVSIRGRRSQKFGSEVPSGVGATGAGFEVALVSVGFFLVAEGDGGFNVPRSKL